MTIRLSPFLLATIAWSAVNDPVAPTRIGPDSLRDTVAASTAPLVRTLPAGFRQRRQCDTVQPCPGDQGSAPETASRKRGRFALIGFVVGATVGAGLYLGECASGECYSLLPAVLLGVAGGVLGTLVGLLLAPSPGG